MPESPTTDRLLTIPEAARRLSISPRTLRCLLSRGELAVVRISPRRIGILPDDLTAFVARRRIQAAR